MPLPFLIELPSIESAIALSGEREENLKSIGRKTGAKLVLRGQAVQITGDDIQVAAATAIVEALEPLWMVGRSVGLVDLQVAIRAIEADRGEDLNQLQKSMLAKTRKGEEIRVKTFRQQRYIQDIQDHSLTICVGPAGTGKTFLATVVAIQALLNHEFERLILTRPAVEAGESLGFLPGDLQQKIDPYLRPLYDAINEFMEPEKLTSMMERGIIEVAPLAYMRGRTLNNAFVILDEAQNTTPSQMKMVLTRLGFKSKMVVTGDLTQTDLPLSQTSGLAVAQRVLQDVEGVAFCEFTRTDVIRHPLVQRIVEAYERYETPKVKE
jgi:phosphate starvation-inducible protein PhoH and related proteins